VLMTADHISCMYRVLLKTFSTSTFLDHVSLADIAKVDRTYMRTVAEPRFTSIDVI
jgi:hypothetical protein